LGIIAFALVSLSLVVSHLLIRDMASEEHGKMELWAEAMRSFNNADDNTDMNLVLKVINENNSIPVIVMDENDNVQTYRNVDFTADNAVDSLKAVTSIGKSLRRNGKYIRIGVDEQSSKPSYIYVCYDESKTLRRLAVFPYIQWSVVLFFVVAVMFAILASKKAEQNKVWVGLSKETAHQLGTPISSLMAWAEILKESYPDDELLGEMQKDVDRLRLIADRFSKIGSVPELADINIICVLNRVVDYMDRRTSAKVTFIKRYEVDEMIVRANALLFEWVVENICKNAVDAMSGVNGVITFDVFRDNGFNVIEISDTGKGIRKKDIKNVFKPGFTTKRRGWGLGLSLARRIIEEYHNGKIYVKCSEVGKGSTIRIELL
jgi:K+-sensing histidine kinase KdpD